uniref:Uncharacterized protein n=1 Tax=Brassica campestris TaxID=3711 RepID=M4FES2_BRACM|nr:unnamed protein product [Brassica rapa]
MVRSDSPSGEEYTPAEAAPTAASFIDTIMEKMAQQDAVQKAMNEQLIAIAAILAPLTRNPADPALTIRRQLFDTHRTACAGKDVLNNLTEVCSSDRTDQTDRAIPHASQLELWLEPQPVFPDQLDILRPTVEPDLAWVVKKPKTNMHSYPADHPDSPASILIFTPCIHLVQMNLDII